MTSKVYRRDSERAMSTYEYNFAAIRGVQAGREYYVSMCPLRVIPKLLAFVNSDLTPELRAQRILNRGRVPEIARYLTGNPTNYTLSSLTASIDGDVRFEPFGDASSNKELGRLRIPMEATVLVHDGQHRHAAIIQALQKFPDLGDETISVVFFVDVGLERCQQMFADLNRYAIRTTSSLGILYDQRDEGALLAKELLKTVPVFSDLTELERGSISNRSTKLFTLSGIFHATNSLFSGTSIETKDEKLETATEFWCDIAAQIPAWQQAKDRQVSSADLRREYIHAHTLALAGLARAGNTLLINEPARSRKKIIAKLKTLDWKRSNTSLWEGRAMNAGRLSKKTINVTLVGNLIKEHLGLTLTEAEHKIETEFRRTKNGRSRKVQ